MHDPFLSKTRQFGLSIEDVASLGESYGSISDVEAHAPIAEPGVPTGTMHVLIEGWALKHKRMSDERRQIIAFQLPGEICDLESLFDPSPNVGVIALTECKVASISLEWLVEARNTKPSIRELLWSLLAREHAAMTEQIVALGRRTSRQRIAYLLCDLLERLQSLGMAEDGRFRMPLTQTDMADALGLSTVHVNRTLQSLKEDGLIEMRGRNVRVPRQNALERAACYEPPRYVMIRSEAAFSARSR